MFCQLVKLIVPWKNILWFRNSEIQSAGVFKLNL